MMPNAQHFAPKSVPMLIERLKLYIPCTRIAALSGISVTRVYRLRRFGRGEKLSVVPVYSEQYVLEILLAAYEASKPLPKKKAKRKKPATTPGPNRGRFGKRK